jgi:hypothetical protein
VVSGLACLFGIHVPDPVNVVEWRDGQMVIVAGVRCARCGIRISEEVIPVAELQEPDHG